MSSRKSYYLSELIEFVLHKIEVKDLRLDQYISTNNMLPNKSGVIPAEEYPTVEKVNEFHREDVLFSNIRTYFEKVWFAQFSGGASSDVLIFRSKSKDILNPHYLYYVLSDKKFIDYTVLTAKGAKMPRGDKSAILQYVVNLPKLQTQQKIAKILGDLDRKIEKNNQINETLEVMAQAIFKSWFVDFDPVHAKVAAKEAGLDTDAINLAAMAVISAKTPAELLSMQAESPADYETLKTTASHFPDSFEDSELGMIPKGWEIKRLSELISITGGGTPKRSEEDYWNGDIPWFSIKDLPKGIFLIDTNEKISEKGLQKSSTKLLKKGTTIITARGTVGKLALLAIDCCMNQSCYGINGKEIGDYYNYFNLKEAVATLKKNVHGAVFDTITTQTFDTYLQVFSGKNITELYESLIKNMMDKMKNNLYQNVELTELRDSLLPKLLSGEIEV